MIDKREFKPRKRKSAFRDASFIVIATEDEYTERQYFLDFISPKYYRNPRVHVEVLKRKTHASSPKHVMDALNKFRHDYRLKDYDELWMIIDRDKWTRKELSDVAAKCVQKGYSLSVSNPCFELWLLLHIKSIDEYTSNEKSNLEKNQKVNGNRTLLEQEISDILGSYNKSNLDTSKFLPKVEYAIEQARQLDTNPGQRWPISLRTRVYRLAERIISD